jgi:hypothetical protein
MSNCDRHCHYWSGTDMAHTCMNTKPVKQEFICHCGKVYGTEQGFKTHSRMKHRELSNHSTIEKEEGYEDNA